MTIFIYKFWSASSDFKILLTIFSLQKQSFVNVAQVVNEL